MRRIEPRTRVRGGTRDRSESSQRRAPWNPGDDCTWGAGAARTAGVGALGAGGRNPPGAGVRPGAVAAGTREGLGPGATCEEPDACPIAGPREVCPTSGMRVGARAPSACAVDGVENCLARITPPALTPVGCGICAAWNPSFWGGGPAAATVGDAATYGCTRAAMVP